MIKDLVNDEAILSQPCAAATAEDAPLAQDLLDTLASLEDAVCLAANQIGVAKAVVAYVDDNEQPHVMYNPKILMGLGPQRLTESCLTHEGESKVTRFVKVKVSYDELVDGQLRHRKGDFVGWIAQMIQQHEAAARKSGARLVHCRSRPDNILRSMAPAPSSS